MDKTGTGRKTKQNKNQPTKKKKRKKETTKGDLPHSHFILFQIIVTWFNQI